MSIYLEKPFLRERGRWDQFIFLMTVEIVEKRNAYIKYLYLVNVSSRYD